MSTRLLSDNRSGKVSSYVLSVLTLVVVGLLAAAFLVTGLTVQSLLGQNKKLREAITHLTQEDQIGYAKVLSQETRNGKLYTKLRFVETARDNKLDKILQKDFTIEGDVVHFDALIVTFNDQMVMNGSKRALYLWRRIYGDDTAPSHGFPIETPGQEPKRYADLLSNLPIKAQKLFWTEIWKLATDPDRLQKYGIKAIYGNVVYSKLRPGLIYVFKISATGQVYPEVVPEM